MIDQVKLDQSSLGHQFWPYSIGSNQVDLDRLHFRSNDLTEPVRPSVPSLIGWVDLIFVTMTLTLTLMDGEIICMNFRSNSNC